MVIYEKTLNHKQLIFEVIKRDGYLLLVNILAGTSEMILVCRQQYILTSLDFFLMWKNVF